MTIEWIFAIFFVIAIGVITLWGQWLMR
jgi:hypothetical protein